MSNCPLARLCRPPKPSLCPRTDEICKRLLDLEILNLDSGYILPTGREDWRRVFSLLGGTPSPSFLLFASRCLHSSHLELFWCWHSLQSRVPVVFDWFCIGFVEPGGFGEFGFVGGFGGVAGGDHRVIEVRSDGSDSGVRHVALAEVTSKPRCALKEVATWECAGRVAVPSTSGRPLSWRVKSECQPSVRWEVRAGTRNGAARDQLFAESDVVEFTKSNALQVDGTGIDNSADSQSLLSEFEGLLTKKSQEVIRLNEGGTIFLVGMMASGKSTVGRVLADALGYSFFDSDEVIESYVGGLPVKEIFRQKSEAAFRDLETLALRELSRANSLVVATGGGAVVRDENWEYLGDGITVWLDVPVEDLARRVTTVGTESRPLLGGDCCDFEKAFLKLSKLMDAREQHYARANCRLSLLDLASSLQVTGVGALTPTAIAVQVLEEITQVLQEDKYIRPPVGY